MGKDIYMYDDDKTSIFSPTLLDLEKPFYDSKNKKYHIDFHIKNDKKNKYYILYNPNKKYYDIYDSQYNDTIDETRDIANMSLHKKLAIRQYSQNISAAIQYLQGDKPHMKPTSNPLVGEA
jgi:hypothetical protein